jgi:hypothetical protein
MGRGQKITAGIWSQTAPLVFGVEPVAYIVVIKLLSNHAKALSKKREVQ